jgi:multiple sugar transport system substrate-binding protein
LAEIDHSVPVPVYYQLKLLIKRQIESGELRPGDKIPTEAELCARHKISRTPVRQAMLELTREGVLTRKAGRGTFVVPVAKQVINLRATLPDERWQWPLIRAAHLWNEANDQKEINLSFTVVPLTSLHDQLSLSVAQGKAPDISLLDSVWVAEFAHRRYLCSLEELDSTQAAEIRDGTYSSLLMANSYRGDQYAVPTNADATVLWYRRDWLEAEGLTPPTDWNQLVSIGQHFRQPRVRSRFHLGPYPLTFAGGRVGGETTTYQLLPILWSFGGDLISDGKVLLDSEATGHAMRFLRSLVQEEKIVAPTVVENTWDSSWRALALGEAALALGGTYENYMIQSAGGWDADQFLDHVGLVSVPGGPRGKPAVVVGCMTYGIYRQSRHPLEALALLKLARTTQILKPFSLQTGQHPAKISVTQAIQPEEDGFLSRTAVLFAQGRSRPSLPTYDRVSAQFQEMAEFCLSGTLTVAAAVRRAAERVSAITDLPLA